ncbi:response regulator [Nitratidesulfovibrio termitidis]|uniref:response regulator n=1 Tax=Nitratidesulfovibrio termitidis TaxID=42252 RepID=UPI0003FE37A2|nr:response regulator [Nitratidesulfovibrio termitidis]
MAAWLLLACCLAAWPPDSAHAATAASAASTARPAATPPAAAPALSNATHALDTSALLATQPLAPFIEFLVDPTGALSVDELLSPSHQAGFTPLGNGLPLFRSGSTWLRLTLAPRPQDKQNPQLLLDLGRDLPGNATLFLARRNQPGEPNEWQAQAPEGGNVFTLPDPVGKPLPVYVKLDGVPGPWFAPMLRTPQNAASNSDGLARPLVIGVLVAVLALCLLRGVFERGEWRLWTSLFVAAVLAQAVAGQPPTPAGYVSLRGLPGVLAPGLALMLLPHVGRHLLRTREHAANADMQLRIVSLAGAVLALLPLVPGMAWSSRLLALWPLLLVLLLPTAVACKFRKLPGSRRFLTGCLAALTGAGAGIAGLASPAPAAWISTAPLWGLALLALLVAGTSAPRPAMAEGTLTGGRGYRVRKSPAAERPDLDDPLADEPTLRMISPEELRGGMAPSPRTPVTTPPEDALFPDDATREGGNAIIDGDMTDEPLELSLGDVLPELDGTPAPRGSRRLARAAAMADRDDYATGFGPTVAEGEDMSRTGHGLSPDAMPPAAPTALDPLALARMEEALLAPIDAMLQELDGLENCALPPAARSHAEAVSAAGRQLASIAEDLGRVAAPQCTAPRRAVFDLQRMLRDAHDAVADRAERKGLAISWFMAPHLSQLYEGDAGQLGELLRLLAESSVRSTDKGSVHMSVRRVPDSTDPGHLLFTVSDSGAGAPPHKRSVSALARAWEMADAAGGTLTVESGRGQGTTISFTARLVALSGDATAPRPFVGVDLTDDLRVARPTPDAITAADQLHLGPVAPRRPLQVIVADDVPSNRQLLAFFLEGLPHAPLEARGATEAGILYRRAPSGLVIMDGDMPEDDIVAALASIRAFEQEHGLPPVAVLALVAHEAQAERMLAAGCTETLEKPLTRSGLRAAVQRLAPPHAEPEPQPAYAEHAGYGDGVAEMPYGEGDDDAHAAPPEFAELPDLFLSNAGDDTDADRDGQIGQISQNGQNGQNGQVATDELSLSGDAAQDWNATQEWNAAPAWDAPATTLDAGYPYDALPESPNGESVPAPSALNESAPYEEAAPAQFMPDESVPAEPATDDPTSWHPWDRPATESPVAGAPEPVPHMVESNSGNPPAAPDETNPDEAEELPELFEADIFAVGHADPAAGPQPSTSGAAPASGVPLEGASLPEGGSLLDLIVTDAEDPEPADDAPAASSQPQATPASAGLIPTLGAQESAAPIATATISAPVAEATIPAKVVTPAWGDDFEESVGEPMPVTASPTRSSVAGTAVTAGQEHASPLSDDAATVVRKPPADGGEWVGEPMPMEPHRSTAHAGPSASSSYGAAARLERWERAQRAQQQGQRAVPHPSPEQRGQQTAEQAPALPQPSDSRPIRDLSAEVRPGYRPKQPPQPAGQAQPGQVTPEQVTAGQVRPGQMQTTPVTPILPAPPAAPNGMTAPAWPTGQQTGQPLPPQMQYTRPQPDQQTAPTPYAQANHPPVQTSPRQTPHAAAHAHVATPPQAAPAKSFAERIAERIAAHLGRGADRARNPEGDTARRAPSQSLPAQPARGGAPATERDERAARPGTAPSRPAAPAPSIPPIATGGQRAEPHGQMGDDIEPFIPGLLETLDAALDDARRGRADGSTFAVQEAAARIAGKAESFGLRVLERIARCVERAATADDMEAVRDLLPELEAAVERNRIALAPRAGQATRRG